ncbi:hypothetical protein H1P_4090002 [Hyella patelloides LEGE 07179]|uniref:Uncharacterized protein n=1 Tax=Hyella patelloides LEGE 07179 TaxID=945734 RepID=A0A563VXI5_9CYAN|nr:hypothetical protein H1P_4090002 [Hyella patelloides LEGE 07179]
MIILVSFFLKGMQHLNYKDEVKMEFSQIQHKLCWYEKHGDNFIGECKLEGMNLSH